MGRYKLLHRYGSLSQYCVPEKLITNFELLFDIKCVFDFFLKTNWISAIRRKIVKSFQLDKVECPVERNEIFPINSSFPIRSGEKAGEAAANISSIYGENVFGESTTRKLFYRIKEGNLT